MLYTSQAINTVFSKSEDEVVEEFIECMMSQGELDKTKLLELLKSNNDDVRWWTIRALSKLNHPPIEKFIELLSDESNEIIQCAILALCHHPVKEAKDKLLEILITEEPLMAKLVGTALIAIGSEVTLDLIELIPLLKGLSKIEGYRALATIRDPRSIPTLMKGLDDESLLVNYWAEAGLSNLCLDMQYLEPL